jgi:tetratricopeptide (TPR) repeat protein
MIAQALLVALALTGQQYTRDDAQKLFAQANDAYLAGKPDEAVTGYEKLLADGYVSPDVEYNLGTALLAQQKIGRSVLMLERARRLAPGEEDIQANLDKARRELVDKVAGGGEEPLGERLAGLLPATLTAGLFLGAYALFWLMMLGRLLWGWTGATLPVAALALVAALPLGGLTALQAYQRTQVHDAVIQQSPLKVREGPNKSSKVSFELHEGTQARVLDREGDFVRLRLKNGLEGWAEATGLEEL